MIETIHRAFLVNMKEMKEHGIRNKENLHGIRYLHYQPFLYSSFQLSRCVYQTIIENVEIVEDMEHAREVHGIILLVHLI